MKALGLESGSEEEESSTRNMYIFVPGCCLHSFAAVKCVSFVRDLSILRQGAVQGTKARACWDSQERKREDGTSSSKKLQFYLKHK